MRLDWKTCFRVCASLFCLYLFVYYWKDVSHLLSTFISALSPLLLGLIMAYVLNILMSLYEAHYFPKRTDSWVAKSRRAVCLPAAVITLVAIGALVVGLVVPELLSCVRLLINEVEPALEKLADSQWAAQLVPADLLNKLDAVNWSDVIDKAVKMVANGLGSAAGTLFTTVSSAISGAVNFFLGFIFAIYLLLDRDRLRQQSRRLMRSYLPSSFHRKLTHCLQVLNECMHKFIVGQCAEALILGVLCAAGMAVFRFPYALMIGTLIGFTALIPIAGAYIGAGVGAVMILTQSPVKALLFLLFIVVLQQLEGNLIYPKVVGNSIGLPALWVLAAITVGGSLMGIPGMLLGVPLAAAFYRLLREDLLRREGKR